MGEKVFVVGVGMTKFEKPGKRDWDYPEMGEEAGRKALDDSGIAYDLVEQAAVGYCFGDSTAGQRALYGVGLSGIPIVNVNNNCATGSSALYLAKRFIEGGLADCTLALGFEKMERGSLGVKFTDRASPMGKFFSRMNKLRGVDRKSPGAPQMFGNAGREYMERYGVKAESFARIGEKNHRHSANNPYSQFRDIYTLQEILAAPMVWDPLTKLQCCPTSDGGAAAVLASERFVRQHGLQAKAVEIIGMAMTTDIPSTFNEGDMKLVGFDMTKKAAQSVYEQSGKGPEDVDVIELHDCFSANEMITYEGLGLCAEGRAAELIDSGAVTYGGKVVVNPSGGLISEGTPARCHGSRAVRGAQLAASRRGGGAPGGRREAGAAAQPRPRWRLRGEHVPQGRSRLTAAIPPSAVEVGVQRKDLLQSSPGVGD